MRSFGLFKALNNPKLLIRYSEMEINSPGWRTARQGARKNSTSPSMLPSAINRKVINELFMLAKNAA